MTEMKPFDYLSPRQLEVTPTTIRRVQLIGGCLFDSWPWALQDLHPAERFDTVVFDHGNPGPPPADCDLRIVQVPLRVICGDWTTMPLGIEDEKPWADLLVYARYAISQFLGNVMTGAGGVPTFVLNYFVPQQNPFGRLFPRYDLRNPVYLVESFNRLLDDVVGQHSGAYVLDADRLASVYGRRYFQEDAFWLTAHNGLIHDVDWHRDKDRLEPEEPLSARYDHDTRSLVRLLWQEAVAMLRTIGGTDRVKLVCVDLDDTLWPGVLAEQGEIDPGMVEGWSIGFAEALTILRKRGVILAIVSKNDETFIEQAFPRLFGARLKLDWFPIRKINWDPKPDNLREAIAEANVLPESVLFIDDNPVERAQALEAIPGLRVLGAPHLDWRRILLWSAELQAPSVTTESLRRNDMIAAQVRREEARAAVPEGDFLTSLEVTVGLGTIASSDHPRFARAFELLNKTNQFNTTGRRWTQDEVERFFAKRGHWAFATAGDRFTQYGLVALALVRGDRIEQMVMSCRVFGLGVEQALVAEVARRAAGRPLSALLRKTDRNGPCRSVFDRLGWRREGKLWFAGEPPAMPAHVTALPA